MSPNQNLIPILFAGNPSTLSVLRQESGFVLIESPMAVAYKLPIKNGPDTYTINEDWLDAMVANYERRLSEGNADGVGGWPGVGAYFNHAITPEEKAKRKQEGPIGIVEKIFRTGRQLMGHIKFTIDAWKKIYADGAMPWRGFSMEFYPNGTDIYGKSIGPTLEGLAVTPDPFLPVTITVSRAESNEAALVMFSHRLGLVPADDPKEDEEMEATKELEAIRAKELETLKAEKAAADQNYATLAKKVEELEATNKTQATAIETQKAEFAKIETAKSITDAKDAIEYAMNKVLIPADVEGYKDETKTLEIFGKLGFTAPEHLKKHADRMSKTPRVKVGATVTSGTPIEGKDDKDDPKVKALAKAHPEMEDEDVEAQAGFLARIEEVRLEASKSNQKLSVKEASLIAAERFPEEYASYAEMFSRQD